MTIIEELKRLDIDISNDKVKEIISEDKAQKFVNEIVVNCEGNAPIVLEKTKQVIKRVITCELLFDAEVDDWIAVLPEWFVTSCLPEMNKQEAERLLKTLEGLEFLTNTWTVSGFVHWFRPEERSWYWWDGIVKDPNSLIVQVVSNGYPFPWGALKFLLKASGAMNAEERQSIF